MQFMLMFRPDTNADSNVPHCKQELPAMKAFCEKLSESGVLLSTVGLLPSAKAARIRYDAGKLRLTDGPFAETKEMLAGVAIVEVSSREQAIEIARQFVSIAAEGECEIRQIKQAEDLVAHATADAR